MADRIIAMRLALRHNLEKAGSEWTWNVSGAGDHDLFTQYIFIMNIYCLGHTCCNIASTEDSQLSTRPEYALSLAVGSVAIWTSHGLSLGCSVNDKIHAFTGESPAKVFGVQAHTYS